jgi:hypothetical protein
MSESAEKTSILKNLDDYANLLSECNRYALLEKNARENRHTVRPHIYARVKNEYADRRGALDQERERQKDALRALLKTILEKRKALNERCRRESDHLEELDFRVRVGEFGEEEVEANRRALKEELLQITKALADVQEIASKFEQIGLPAQGSAPAAKPGPDATEGTAHDLDDFLVLEEDPSSVVEDSLVVNLPPTMSAGSSPEGLGEAQGISGAALQPRSDAHVAGYLIALDGSRKGERFPLISTDITVGSSPGIDIRLADSGIAQLHARIVYQNRRHYLETLEAEGSCLINGVQIDKAELKDGDVLSLGEITMQVEFVHEATA